MKLSISTANTIKAIEAHVAKSSKSTERALKVSGMEMVKELKNMLRLNATRYKRYVRRSVEHWSSRPGSPPNPDTGFLGQSVKLSSMRKAGSVFVIVAARYARRLEFGTRSIKKRPFVKPVRDMLAPIFRRRIIKALNDA